MKPRNFKRIWGKNWDWAYLLHLEQRKLIDMANCFEKNDLFEGVEKVVRDMRICVKLIDIICENDTPYKAWLHASFGGDKKEEVPFSRHINVNNRKRIFKELHQKDYIDNAHTNIKWTLKASYRQQKALYLYHKIRMVNLMAWWF